MEGRKKMEEFYRKLKVGMKLKYAFTTVIVTFAVAMVVSLVSIVMMNVSFTRKHMQTAHCRWKSVKIYSLWENIFCGR